MVEGAAFVAMDENGGGSGMVEGVAFVAVVNSGKMVEGAAFVTVVNGGGMTFVAVADSSCGMGKKDEGVIRPYSQHRRKVG